jgi:hypothetical protein
MIAEATASGREAAEQLARDRAPGIMEENELTKTVRVVSTIEHCLN